MITLLDKVKLSLRVSGDAFNEEITDLIEAAKLDLMAAGILENKVEEPDAWIQRAIVLYAKANFGMANPDSEKYSDAYHNVRMKISLRGGYNGLLE